MGPAGRGLRALGVGSEGGATRRPIDESTTISLRIAARTFLATLKRDGMLTPMTSRLSRAVFASVAVVLWSWGSAAAEAAPNYVGLPGTDQPTAPSPPPGGSDGYVGLPNAPGSDGYVALPNPPDGGLRTGSEESVAARVGAQLQPSGSMFPVSNRDITALGGFGAAGALTAVIRRRVVLRSG